MNDCSGGRLLQTSLRLYELHNNTKKRRQNNYGKIISNKILADRPFHCAVFVMPRMQIFLSSNGPWDQLVRLKNIMLQPMQNDSSIVLNHRIRMTPFLVPHRDEYTETVGFRITGPQRSVLFIPDIDKWEKWERRIEDMITSVEVAYLDGTFYAEGEIPGRNMKEIPHPFIVETVARLAALPMAQKNKVRSIHLNHTNPALHHDGEAMQAIQKAGFHVAAEKERIEL